jgi:hypothetical protein
MSENGVLIKPAEVIVSEALDEIGKVLKAKGISLEDLIDQGREIRGEWVDEKLDRKDE